MDVCGCCDKTVPRLHFMEWDNDFSWLCDDCAEQAAEENDQPTETGEDSEQA